MTKEGKTITLAGVTVCMFALTGLLKDKVIIFPFPLNEIIFLIVALYFGKLHFKTSPYTVILTIIIGLSSVLSSEFYWNIFLGAKNMYLLSESILTDVFKLAYHICLILWMISTFSTSKSTKIRILGILPIFILAVGSYFNLPILEFSSITFLFFYSIFHVKHSPPLYLWILLFILELSKVWSLASLV